MWKTGGSADMGADVTLVIVNPFRARLTVATFTSATCSGLDVGWRAGEYETDPDARTSEHRPQFREGSRVCRFDAEIMPGPATGVLIREDTW